MNVSGNGHHLPTTTKFSQFRTVIAVVSIFVAVLAYIFVINYWAPSDNIFRMLNDNSKFKFYSGPPNGIYIKIGNYLSAKSKDESDITIVQESTDGDIDNWNKVLTHPNSFTLANEVSAPLNEDNRSKANFITPVYMERLHIFYRKDTFKKAVLKAGGSKEDTIKAKPMLTVKPDKFTNAFLSVAKINGGKQGSGTRLIASYFLNVIEGFESKSLLDNLHTTGIKMLKGGDSDIHFAMMGDPISWIDSLIKNSDYGLISIDPVLNAKVNSTYKLNLQLTDFKGKYMICDEEKGEWIDQEGVKNITTSGSYVNLFASYDITAGPIIELLELLNIAEAKDFQLETSEYNKDNYQLAEVNFDLPIKRIEYEMTTRSQSGILFLLIVFFASMAIFWFLINFISRTKIARYFRIINEIYQDHFTPKFQLKHASVGIVTPIIGREATPKIREICTGYQKIFNVRNRAYSDYKNGKITERDYKGLLKGFQVITNNFKTVLHQQIYYGIKNDEQIEPGSLQDFFVAGVLKSNDYEQLLKLLRGKNELVN